MMDKQTTVFCPIHNCGCYDLSCDGVLPVHTHEDCQEHEDGETRLKLVCLKGDMPHELPNSYTQGELEQMIAGFVAQKPIVSSGRHYATRKAISVRKAAKITGLSESTIKRLDKDPKNTKYPGRNVEEWILESWGTGYHKEEKIARREVRNANRPSLGAKRE